MRRWVATSAAAVMVLVGSAGPASADPVTVTPSSAGMPLTQTISKLLGWLAQTALWGSLASILVGAAVWGLSKWAGNYSGSHKGMMLVLGGCIGAVLTGVAPTLVNMFYEAS